MHGAPPGEMVRKQGCVMSGDWVKMRVLLGKDPKVIAIGGLLAEDERFKAWSGCDCVSRRMGVAATVAALLLLWGVAREQGRQVGDDLVLDHASLDSLDLIAETPGLGDAMAAVDWAEQGEDGTIVLPKFFRQNASTENRDKKREADRERMRDKRAAEKASKLSPVVAGVARDSHATVAEESPPVARVEERRGEYIQTPLPPKGDEWVPPGQTLNEIRKTPEKRNKPCDRPDLVPVADRIIKHYQRACNLPEPLRAASLSVTLAREQIVGLLGDGSSESDLAQAACRYATETLKSETKRQSCQRFYSDRGSFSAYVGATPLAMPLPLSQPTSKGIPERLDPNLICKRKFRDNQPAPTEGAVAS